MSQHKCYACAASFSDKYLKYRREMKKIAHLPFDELEKAEQKIICSLVRRYCCRASMKTIIPRSEQMKP